MSHGTDPRLSSVLAEEHDALLEDWLQHADPGVGTGAAADLRHQASEVLRLLASVSRDGSPTPDSAEAGDLRAALASIALARSRRGAKTAETAQFILSLKQPIFERLRRHLGDSSPELAGESWKASLLLDQLAIWTMEAYQQSREDVIARQQEELLELSTPVVKLWKGVLGLPLIGILDSERTQVVTEQLLERLIETGSSIAIIDITGVPTVDTRVAQHLLQTVAAARLMGADCIISGIRPQIAQTIVHLGLVLEDVVTKATLADAFKLALERLGLEITERQPARSNV